MKKFKNASFFQKNLHFDSSVEVFHNKKAPEVV